MLIEYFNLNQPIYPYLKKLENSGSNIGVIFLSGLMLRREDSFKCYLSEEAFGDTKYV
jgi:hypothetical protein